LLERDERLGVAWQVEVAGVFALLVLLPVRQALDLQPHADEGAKVLLHGAVGERGAPGNGLYLRVGGLAGLAEVRRDGV